MAICISGVNILKLLRLLKKPFSWPKKAAILGRNILGSGFNFRLEVFKGAGAYVCGEETSLLNSMAGLRPFPNPRPPFPTQSGFRGKPTAVCNIETLANIPFILARGGAWLAGIGNPQ